MANVEFNDGPYLTIPGTRRTMDGRLVELRDAPDGYVYVPRSHRLHGPLCGSEIRHGEPWQRDRVIAAWHDAPEHPVDPLWCTNCMQVPVDEVPHSQPSRRPDRIEAVGRGAAPVLDHLFGDRRSVIVPDREIWTADVGRAVLDAVTARRDPGRGTISSRLRAVMGEPNPETTLFVAEVMYLRTLPLVGSVSPEYKEEAVTEILSWLDPAPPVPARLAEGMRMAGAFNGGAGYNKGVWRHLRWFAQLVIALDALDDEARAALRTDPWRLRELLVGELADPPSIRNALLAMAFPATFEFVISDAHKRRIRAAFADRIGGPSGTDPLSIDRDLAAIRESLSDDAAGYVDWYSRPWKTTWQEPAGSAAAPAPELAPDALATESPALPRASQELADQLHIDRGWLDEYLALLASRRQIIVFGPPGTGKTYVARAIARHVTGLDPTDASGPAASTSPVVLVQFHPSYAYEDFFEGLRPTTDERGQVTFAVQPGPLRRLAERAAARPDQPHVLIIDEINRANIAKVFGELYYLLEYRGDEVALQYTPDRPFSLPDNLYVIGTMNTADRSIALIDAAIRRRFSFIEMHPSEEPVAGLLERAVTLPGDPRPALLRALNAAIGEDDRDFHVGPSYLMRPEADSAAGLDRVWRHDILPLLEEHYYGRFTRAEVVRQFGLPAIQLRAGVAAHPDPPADDGVRPLTVGWRLGGEAADDEAATVAAPEPAGPLGDPPSAP